MTIKGLWGLASVGISILAYAIYLRETTTKAIQPHPFSWLVWGFVTTIAAWIQHIAGAGPGLWVTAFTAACCFLITGLTLRNKWQFSVSDWVALVLGIVAAVIYATIRNASVAAILATIADVIGYLPTLKKGWLDPQSENAWSFLLNGLKFLVALKALDAYSLATWLYPTTLTIANSGVWVMLHFRTYKIASRNRHPQ